MTRSRAEIGKACGVDLSLASTGLALIGAGALQLTHTIPSTGRRADAVKQRASRIAEIVAMVRDWCDGSDLVVLEGPSIMSRGGSNWDRAWLWGRTVDRLLAINVPVAVAPPTVVKKWAADKGSADKAAVAAAMTRLWPDVEPHNDNEFDALALATMGAQRLGLDVPSRAHHAAALEKVEWPDPMPWLSSARGYGEPLEEKA